MEMMKKLMIIAGIIIAGGLIYFGMQHRARHNSGAVKIQACVTVGGKRVEGEMCT